VRAPLSIALVFAAVAQAQYVGSEACQPCHPDKVALQAKSAHAAALKVAPKGSPGQWAFGAGQKATTWVTQKDDQKIVEHGLSYYASTKTMGLTPGHDTATDLAFRTFDPIGTALRCFRCHSTGPVSLGAQYKVQPSELGIRCEACHGPGSAHVQGGPIQNPARLNPTELNELCGACHRQASSLDDDTDWGNPWNLRHQPSYLHRAACFRNSEKLSCLTCHDPHAPIQKVAAAYDAKCSTCHPKLTHKAITAAKSCVSCHMPQVAASKSLTFTNHWIGIYDQPGAKLAPSRRLVKSLKPSPVAVSLPPGFIIPASPATLAPVYAKALAEREQQLGPDDPKVARAASDLGLFLLQNGSPVEAEPALRRAVTTDQKNGDPQLDASHENLATALEANGRQAEAVALFRAASQGKDQKVAARALLALARLDGSNAELYYRQALAAEEEASGSADRRVATILHELALALREKQDDAAAEPLLRRALAIQQKVAKPDFRLTVAIMNTLGNLIEGARRFDEAERLERIALQMAEDKLGPESRELAMTCTSLADVLWNKHDLQGAGQLYRRAFTINASLYGPETPEAAADMANLGMVSKEAGQREPGNALLRQALAIYEKTLGANSAQADFVRQNLAR
jgi:tetratricopeptide (TPR) repeat protein